MKLFYRKYGEGQPLIILHGLFGQSDNWNTLGKAFAEQGYEVYLVDLRNHGQSPHSEEWSYSLMSNDVFELINDLHITTKNSILMGHSMGGKVAMQFAIEHSDILAKLIVVDIAPKFHLPDNADVVKALSDINIATMKSRKEVQSFLSDYISDEGTMQFLLKNIQWKQNGDTLEWKFNRTALLQQMHLVREVIDANTPCVTPTLFIRGEKSTYILDEDIPSIKKLFPNSSIETIMGAGHWVHAAKPMEFFEVVISFLKE